MFDDFHGLPEFRPSFSAPDLKIATAFFFSFYPLSEVGKELKRLMDRNGCIDPEKVKSIAPFLPTVENPNLSLFKPLSLPPNMDTIFSELSNLQITKGCSHNCSFCAANSAENILYMPFPVIAMFSELLKNSQEYKTHESIIRDIKLHGSEWDSVIETWLSNYVTGAKTFEAGHIWFTYEMDGILHCPHESNISPQELQNLTTALQRTEAYKNAWIQQNGITVDEAGSPIVYRSGMLVSKIGKQLSNYYDSDPFDYRDRKFLHADGTPANFGDVVELLGSAVTPIGITTAGWATGNEIAKKAAQKIVSLYKKNPKILASLRISINPTERIARLNPKQYLENMIDVIKILAPANPELLLFYEKTDEHKQFKNTVISSILFFIKRSGLMIRCHYPQISNFSGRSNERGEGHDVMACMAGYHIVPMSPPEKCDESVRIELWKQEKRNPDPFFSKNPPGDAKVGARPTTTGHCFWKTNGIK